VKLQNKVLLISFGVAVLITLVIAFATDSWPGNGFCLLAGLTGIFGAAGYLGLSLLLLFLKDKSYSKGLALCSVILFLLGFILFKFLPQY
jgi:hypothetical protein